MLPCCLHSHYTPSTKALSKIVDKVFAKRSLRFHIMMNTTDCHTSLDLSFKSANRYPTFPFLRTTSAVRRKGVAPNLNLACIDPTFSSRGCETSRQDWSQRRFSDEAVWTHCKLEDQGFGQSWRGVSRPQQEKWDRCRLDSDVDHGCNAQVL